MSQSTQTVPVSDRAETQTPAAPEQRPAPKPFTIKLQGGIPA